MTHLEELLTQPEGKTLEFKRDLSARDGILKTLIAFANGAGGTLIIGVEDQTKKVLGIKESSKGEEFLASIITASISPRLLPEIRIASLGNNNLIIVQVYPSSSRPHFLQSLGADQGIFVRVGSTNRRADQAQIDEMKRISRGRGFDEEPMSELSSEAIDFQLASECFSDLRKLKKTDLKSLLLLTNHQGKEVPTVGGVLLFGKKRHASFPDAFLRAGAFKGVDKTNIVDSSDLIAVFPKAIEEALYFVQKNTKMAIQIKAAKHIESWDFPLVAVREAVINAFTHADYAQRGSPLKLALFHDRLEIENPGGLSPGLTVDDIRDGISKLRNRVIGRVFHELGLIEQWGSGIQRILSSCKDAGLVEPKFEEKGSGFRVTLYKDKAREVIRDPIDEDIISFLKKKKQASSAEIAKKIELTSRAVRDRLRNLIDLGIVAAIGTSPNDPKRVYFLNQR
jgi:ATP-dependent DNA helicase RecG